MRNFRRFASSPHRLRSLRTKQDWLSFGPPSGNTPARLAPPSEPGLLYDMPANAEFHVLKRFRKSLTSTGIPRKLSPTHTFGSASGVDVVRVRLIVRNIYAKFSAYQARHSR